MIACNICRLEILPFGVRVTQPGISGCASLDWHLSCYLDAQKPADEKDEDGGK